jgi:hypothetical protein
LTEDLGRQLHVGVKWLSVSTLPGSLKNTEPTTAFSSRADAHAA